MTAGRFETRVYADRLAAAAAATAAAGLDGLVITSGYDLRYLVGSRAQTFERLTALVIPAVGAPVVVLPRLELAALRESAAADLGLAVQDWVDGENPYDIVADALGGAIRRNEVRVFRLKLLEPLHQSIVLEIADLGRGIDVILEIMVAN